MLQILHSDLYGQITPADDDLSNYIIDYLKLLKSLKNLNVAQAIFILKDSKLRYHNGHEYISNSMEYFCLWIEV